jgi:hypothetical protein
MLLSIGKVILVGLAILLGSAVLAGFGVLCLVLGVGAVPGFFSYVREQPGVQKLTTALIFGPFATLWVLVCLGLAASSFIPLPALLFSWLAPPSWVAQVDSWLGGPGEQTLLAHLSLIGFAVLGSSFALGISLTCFFGIPEMVRTIHSLFDFIAVIFALGMGLVFLYISVVCIVGIVTGSI